MIGDTKAALAAHARQPQGRVRSLMDDDEPAPETRCHQAGAAVTARIVDALRSSRVSMSADEIARATGIHRNTARTYVTELHDAGLLVITAHRKTRGRPTPCYAAKS